MMHLVCHHSDDIDDAGNLLSYSDASADFGPGAVVVSCPCGGWLIEDESGRVLATSDAVVVIEQLQAA